MKYQKWMIVVILSMIFSPGGVSAGVVLIHFASWLDVDILDNECSYEICPLKYDIIEIFARVLIILVSFLIGYLMYCFIKIVWNKFDSKEVKIATTT